MADPFSPLRDALHDRRIAISIADPDLEDCPLVFVNRAFCLTTGYREDDCLGRNCRFLQSEELAADQREAVRADIAARTSFDFIVKNRTRTGRIFTNFVVIRPFRIDPDKILLLGCQYDVQGHETEDALAAQRNRVDDVVQSIQDTRERSRALTFEARRHMATAVLNSVLGRIMRRR